MKFYEWEFYINDDTTKTYKAFIPVFDNLNSDEQNIYYNNDDVPYYATVDDNDLPIPHKVGLVGLFEGNSIYIPSKATNIFDIFDSIYGNYLNSNQNIYIILRTVGGRSDYAITFSFIKTGGDSIVIQEISFQTNYPSSYSERQHFGYFNKNASIYYYNNFFKNYSFYLGVDKNGKIFPILRGNFRVYTKYGYKNWGWSTRYCILGGLMYSGEFSDFFQKYEEVKRYPVTVDNEWGNGVIDNSSDNIDFPPIPTISVNQFTHTYVLNNLQLESLKNELFSDDFISIIKKWWEKPLDCIVAFYVLPLDLSSIVSEEFIKVGIHSMDSKGNLVNSCLYEVDCGTVDVFEYYGNFADYENTIIQCYLPFVGFIPIKTVDVMGGRIHLKYIINLITGGFNCFLLCERNRYDVNLNSVLYETSGNMATQLPITSSDFSNLIQNVANTIISTASTVATGGFGISNAISSVGGLLNSSPAIQRSGTFDKNASLCAMRKPFLLIERPRMVVPNNFEKNKGFLSNRESTINDLSGYTEISYINLDNLNIPKDCADELKNALQNGIFI